MLNVEFKAGYYEWNVFINGEYFYTFGDSVDEDIYEDTDIELVVEDYIDLMQMDLYDNDREPLDEKYIPELKKQMMEVWGCYYGISA